jgi:formylglycine-generating enzyme required for sulfatase activity
MQVRSAVLLLVPFFAASVLLNAADDPALRTPPLPRLPFDGDKAVAFQQEWARAAGLDVHVTNSVGMKLVLIPGGRFDMGPNGSTCRVTLSKPFYLGVTEVTLGQYRRFKAGHKIEGAEAEFNADDRPAAMVSWHDARAYCAWLSEQPDEKAAGRVYVLPTEAQWEWAARAGTATTRYFGDTDKRPGRLLVVQRHVHSQSEE